MTDPSSTVGAHQATAARNIEAILETAERLLTSGRGVTFAAVAEQAGVSRPTLYAHFADRRLLLTAVMERSIGQALAAIESAQPERGPAPEALSRLALTGWEHLARHVEISRAAASELPAGAVHAHHEQALKTIETLVRRGQRDGSFRRDMPPAWLATSCLALIHAAAHAVGSGQMKPAAAKKVLPATLVDLCTGPSGTQGR